MGGSKGRAGFALRVLAPQESRQANGGPWEGTAVAASRNASEVADAAYQRPGPVEPGEVVAPPVVDEPVPGVPLVVLEDGVFTEPAAPAPAVPVPEVARPRVRLRAPVEVVDVAPVVEAPADMPGSLIVEPATPGDVPAEGPVVPMEPAAPALMPGWPDMPVVWPMPEVEPAAPVAPAPDVPPADPEGMAPPGVEPPVDWANAAPPARTSMAAEVRRILRMEESPWLRRGDPSRWRPLPTECGKTTAVKRKSYARDAKESYSSFTRRLRKLGLSVCLRRRIDLGVTSTNSSSSM